MELLFLSYTKNTKIMIKTQLIKKGSILQTTIYWVKFLKYIKMRKYINIKNRSYYFFNDMIPLNQEEIRKIIISNDFRFHDGVENFIKYKIVKLISQYFLFYLRWVDLLNVLKKEKILFSCCYWWWWKCNFEIQENLEKKK